MTFTAKEVAEFFEAQGWDYPNNFGAEVHDSTYDAFELNPVVILVDDQGNQICEAITYLSGLKDYLDEEFDQLIFTVYGHLVEGGIEAIHDYSSLSRAEEAYRILEERFISKTV